MGKTERVSKKLRGIKMNKDKALEVDQMLPMGKLIAFALQHVFAMCAGAVAVPLIIGNAAGLTQEEIIFLVNCDLMLAGIATLIQSVGFTKFVGARIPMIEGTSFATVSAMAAIAGAVVKSGVPNAPHVAMQTIFGSVLVAGVFTFIMAPFWSKLLRFFPKVVTGTVVTVIGISLLPVAIKWTVNYNFASPEPRHIYMAMTTLGLILLFNKTLKGLWGNISILLGLVVGTVIATMNGMADFSKVSEASLINVATPFKFGMPIFDITAIISILLVTLVIMTEATGNIIAIHEFSGRKLDDKNLARGLRTDGLATMLASIFNTFPHTAFAQNVGLVTLTGVKSRFVTAGAGVILLILGFLPKAAATVVAIPAPVLGGAGFIMFGIVAASGIRHLGHVNYNGNKNMIIVCVSIGAAMVPVVAPNFYHNFPHWVGVLFHSGITTGSVVAIFLNIFFNEIGKKKEVATEAETKTA